MQSGTAGRVGKLEDGPTTGRAGHLYNALTLGSIYLPKYVG